MNKLTMNSLKHKLNKWKMMIKQFRPNLLALSRDIYDAVDSCETAQEIWLRVQQMMKGSDIGIQEKKAKLFNEGFWSSARNYIVRTRKGAAYFQTQSKRSKKKKQESNYKLKSLNDAVVARS
ncbi:hypothetical protein Tco_1303936 [Tanacetum coccineum]